MSIAPDPAHMTFMTTFYGYVQADSRSFWSHRPDIAKTFHPINTHYGTVHPTEGPGDSLWAVEFELHPGECFQVREDIDMTEGRGGTLPAGNFLHYPDAYGAARGKGAQGSRGAIEIMTSRGSSDITALAQDGSAVTIGTLSEWIRVPLSSRVRFPNRESETS